MSEPGRLRDDLSLAPVVIVHPSNEWYGADRMLTFAAQALRSEGREVTILLPGSPTDEPTHLESALRELGCVTSRRDIPALRRREITISRFPKYLTRLLRFVRDFRLVAPKQSLVILNTNALAPLSLGLRLTGIRTVGYLHEIPFATEGRVLGQLWRSSRSLVAISSSVKSALPRSLHARTHVVRNCANRQEPLALPTDPPLEFLFIGRLSPRKGIRELVECFKELDSRRHHLTVIGGFAELGAQIDWAELEVAMREAHVDYAGEVTDPGPFIDRAHIVVVPSLLPEGLGLTAIESLARGRPVVATDVPGLTEVVDETVGWRMRHDDSGSWASTIESITLDDVLARQDACVSRFERMFSPEAYTRLFQSTMRSQDH